MTPGPIVLTQVPIANGVSLPDHRLVMAESGTYTVEKRSADARGADSWATLTTISPTSQAGASLASNILYRLLLAHAITRASFAAESGIYRVTLAAVVDANGLADEAKRYYTLERQTIDSTGTAAWSFASRITSSAATPADIKQDALAALLDLATVQPVTVAPD